MPKKPITSRLENLFAQLEDLEQPAPFTGRESLPVWTWEIDTQGRFTKCSQEVAASMGFQAVNYIGQSIYQFGLAPQSVEPLRELLATDFDSTEIDVHFLSAEGAHVPVRLTITRSPLKDGQQTGWYGSASVINGTPVMEQVRPVTPIRIPTEPKQPYIPPSTPAPKKQVKPSPKPKPQSVSTASLQSPVGGQFSSTISGIAITNEGLLQPANQLWTNAGFDGLRQNKPVSFVDSGNTTAFAVPFQLRNQAAGILELVDESGQRQWSEDDQLLAQEVMNQLTLALENAQLYNTVQQELSERIKAEQEITRRNQDLAVLNQIGQKLSKLATPEEIFELVDNMVGQVLDNKNLTIVVFDRTTNEIRYPVCKFNGQTAERPEIIVGQGIPQILQRTKAPLLLTTKIEETLAKSGVELPDPLPKSLLAVPLLAGERVQGAIILQDYSRETAFTQIQSELLSTVASQAATALENANLFQEIRTAFQAIENRERYQGNVAKAVANLTEQGSKSIPAVLELLGLAAATDRVYFAQARDSDEGAYWRITSTWLRPGSPAALKSIRTQEIPVGRASELANQLREKGFVSALPGELTITESRLLLTSPKDSFLAIGVRGKGSTPSFIAFEEVDSERQWLNEEINVLQVAADALSNTYIREDLLVQIQSSLDETENLYNTSHELALAVDFDKMVVSLAEGLQIPDINRALLLLSEFDPQGILLAQRVAAAWYSNKGTPPPDKGTDFSDPVFENLFYQQSSTFIDDINAASIDPDAHQILSEQNVRALASLPLRTAKQQIGTLVLMGDFPHNFNGRETRSLNSLADQMSTAVENRQLFEQTQFALSETELLYKVSAGISQASTPQDLIRLVADNVLPQKAERASLMMISSNDKGEPTDIEVVGFYDRRGEFERLGLHIQPSAFPAINSIADDSIVVPNVNSSNLDAQSKKTLTQLKIGSGVFVPLRSSGRLVGIIAALSTKPSDFTNEEIRMMQVTGSGVAVAVERQRLLQEAQRRALELQTAAEIARDTTSTLAMDALLERITNLVIERFGFYHVSIYLLDESNNFAVIRESTGSAGADMKAKGYRLAVGSRSIVGSVTATGKPLIVNDVNSDPLYYPHPLLPDTRAEMTLPLKAGNRITGAFDIQSKNANAFTEADLAVFQILTDQIAVGIENARSYELSQKAFEEIREVDRMKTQFLANMSHELRTPLNSIIGFSRVILKGIDGPINDTQKQDLTAIYNSGQHLLGLINNVLDLSKIEAGKMELQFSEININDLVVTTMSTAIGLTKDKPIKLHQIVPPDLPVVRADVTRVRQVLLNFISNAAKFTEEGSITVEVSLVNSPTNTPEVMLSVTDTGPGIAEKDRYKLFQPFSQVDDSPTRKTGGTGLGLSICKSFIEMHKGRIGLLSSELGKGSTFFFTLPLPLPEPVAPESDGSSDEKVILSIEDDPQVISLYERYLKPQGYTIIPLTDSTKAIETAVQLKPFAITLDLMMPNKDGWTVMNELKNNPATRDIPVVICSILEEEEKGFSLGAADYLVKPFLQEDLINTVNRLNHAGKIQKILVVDDDEDDLRLVEKILAESKQFETILAKNGTEGLEKMGSEHPDAVILDLFLPDTNGFAILEKMRTDNSLKQIPVIILTGADLTPEQHQQLAQFGQQMLNKATFRERELLNILDEALLRIQKNK